MSNLVRFDPFAQIDALQKQFFDEDWFTPMRGVHMPTTDVYTNDDKEMVVEAQLPHFSDDDVHVSIDDNYLVIQAEKREQAEDRAKKYVVRESSSSLYRRIYLPERADSNKTKAKFSDGVLKVTVPFSKLPQSKKITIDTKPAKRAIG